MSSTETFDSSQRDPYIKEHTMPLIVSCLSFPSNRQLSLIDSIIHLLRLTTSRLLFPIASSNSRFKMESFIDTSSLLLRLPLELRREIYSQVLPHENVHTTGPQWLGTSIGSSFEYDDSPEGGPQGSTRILLACRQVYEESATMLYSEGLHTVTICAGGFAGTAFLEKEILPSESGHPKIPAAAKFVRNWQIDIWRTEFRYTPEPTVKNFKQAMLTHYSWHKVLAGISLCEEMFATVQDLKTITFKLPGHCCTRFVSWKTSVDSGSRY